MGVHVCTTWRLWVNWGLAFLILPLVPLLMGAFEEETRCVQWLAWVAYLLLQFLLYICSFLQEEEMQWNEWYGQNMVRWVIYHIYSPWWGIEDNHMHSKILCACSLLIPCREPELYACMPDGPRHKIHKTAPRKIAA